MLVCGGRSITLSQATAAAAGGRSIPFQGDGGGGGGFRFSPGRGFRRTR